MATRKEFQELILKDNFLFGAVMTDEEICREFLELALEIPISHVEVDREYSIIYHPEFRGVRLDVYAKDKANTHYNVEMQVVPEKDLGKRSRYYHSQVDMELLRSGQPYEKLPECFVIFICDFDPFGLGLYRYTFQKQCQETQSLFLEEGSNTLFLSTCGKNQENVSPELIRFLEFVKTDLAGSQQDFEDEFVRKLQASIRRIKQSREMEGRFMTFEELLRDERKEGKAEGKAEDILEFLQDLGTVPKELEEQIMAETDLEKLKHWLKLSARADSLEAFFTAMDQV